MLLWKCLGGGEDFALAAGGSRVTGGKGGTAIVGFVVFGCWIHVLIHAFLLFVVLIFSSFLVFFVIGTFTLRIVRGQMKIILTVEWAGYFYRYARRPLRHRGARVLLLLFLTRKGMRFF